jgi:tonB-dependent receptor plug
VYSQVRNLGLIWAANKEGIDPDYISGSVLRPEVSFTFGLNVNF